MKSSITLALLVIFAFHACKTFGDQPVFMSQSSMTLHRQVFTDAATQALQGATSALPIGIGSGLRNPALVANIQRNAPLPHGTFMAGYGADSVYNKFIIPVGLSYTYAEGTIAGFYRYLSGENGLINNEFIFNISGQLFDSTAEQGSVDIGFNVRFETLHWNTRSILPLTEQTTTKTAPSGSITSTSLELYELDFKPRLQEKRVTGDLGFYQTNVTPGIDFALVIQNITGYRWGREKPDTSIIIESDTIHDTITKTIQYKYHDRYRSYNGWIEKGDRVFILGAVYTSKGDVFQIKVPFDIDMWGLFDKKVKNRFVLRTGAQLQIVDNYSLRFGYANRPALLDEKSVTKNNYISGGIGIKIESLALDFYVDKSSWGITTAFNY